MEEEEEDPIKLFGNASRKKIILHSHSQADIKNKK